MKYEIDRHQRLILFNQYTILAEVDARNKKHWERAAQVVSLGFEGEYQGLFSRIDDETLSKEECVFVLDTLDMFRAIHFYGERHDDSTFNKRNIRFEGFDGNHESAYHSYLHFLREDEKWEELMPHGAINSHHPTLNRYRRMVAEWHKSQDKYQLTEADIARISTAGGFFTGGVLAE